MPNSLTLPSSITAMRSAMRTVEKRCEMTMPMRPRRISFSSAKIAASASGSRDDGGLVEDPDVRVAIHDARQREALPFAARQIVAAFEQPAHLRVESLGHLLQQPVAARVFERAQYFAIVGNLPGTAHLHVLANGKLVARKILEQHADAAAPRLRIELAQIGAAHANGPMRGIVETQQQLDQRALAGAVLADQGDQLAAANVQAEILHRGFGAARIGKRHIVELDAGLERFRHLARPFRVPG